MPIEVETYGNTGPASIPLTLCTYFNKNKPKLGSSILCGFGVGLSWGAVLLNLNETTILDVQEL